MTVFVSGAQVFKKNGLVGYDPQGEAFDPNLHNAVFEVKDGSQPEGTVASVMKVRGGGRRVGMAWWQGEAQLERGGRRGGRERGMGK